MNLVLRALRFHWRTVRWLAFRRGRIGHLHTWREACLIREADRRTCVERWD